jgi:hypothetical protein
MQGSILLGQVAALSVSDQWLKPGRCFLGKGEPIFDGVHEEAVGVARQSAWKAQCLRQLFEQVFRSDGECLCQFHYVFQSHVALSTFDAAYVISMYPGSLRKMLLGIAAFLSQGAQRRSEDGLSRSFRHSLMLGV